MSFSILPIRNGTTITTYRNIGVFNRIIPFFIREDVDAGAGVNSHLEFLCV
jgi:hypothetical protein